jgi:hypothetical protein
MTIHKKLVEDAHLNEARGETQRQKQRQLEESREGRRAELEVLTTLQTCASEADVQVLVQGPSAFSERWQPLQRIKQQLDHLKKVRKWPLPRLTGLKKQALIDILLKVVTEVAASEAQAAVDSEAAAAAEGTSAAAAAAAAPAAEVAAAATAAAVTAHAPAHKRAPPPLFTNCLGSKRARLMSQAGGPTVGT